MKKKKITLLFRKTFFQFILKEKKNYKEKYKF